MSGMALPFSSTVTNSIVMVATAPIVVAAADVLLVKLKIATATVAQKLGSLMAIAMMARMSGMALPFSSTVTNSIVTVATAPVVVAAVIRRARAA